MQNVKKLFIENICTTHGPHIYNGNYTRAIHLLEKTIGYLWLHLKIITIFKASIFNLLPLFIPDPCMNWPICVYRTSLPSVGIPWIAVSKSVQRSKVYRNDARKFNLFYLSPHLISTTIYKNAQGLCSCVMRAHGKHGVYLTQKILS